MERPKKRWRTNALFLIALWLILLVASLTILSSVITPFLKTLKTQSLVSFDWAGYTVSSNPILPRSIVSGVNGSWIVPSVSPAVEDTYSATWIGIGGQNENTLIQIGSEQDSIGGKPAYWVWYEMLPDDSITIQNFPVSAGDQITASITLQNSNTNEWLMKIDDTTSGGTFSQIFTYNSSRLTAEWIVERPTVNNQLSTLSDFGAITFTNISARINNSEGNLNAYYNYLILMEDRQNNQLVNVSDYTTDGSSFTISNR